MDDLALTDFEKWHYIVASLVGGLGYEGVHKWLAKYSSLDEAYEAAKELRGSVFT